MTDAGPPPPPPPPDPSTPPPGWYPTTPGMQGYWDGTRWTGDVAPRTGGGEGDDTTMGMLAHLLGLFTGFLGPLILYLVKKDDSDFVRHHAAEALNFQITVIIAAIVSFMAIFVLIGILLLPVVFITALVFEIMGAVKANRGEWWRYPINIRLVS